MWPIVRFALALGCFALLAVSPEFALAGRGGQLEINVVDRDTGKPLAARMHLKNAQGKAQRPPKTPFWHDHFVFSGSITLKLPNGHYAFEMECGPEYLLRSGHFSISDFAEDAKVVDMKRFVNMSEEGWWSGDMNVQRGVKDLELLMLADDLRVAQAVTWTNGKSEWASASLPAEPLKHFDGQHYFQALAGLDNQPGGAVLLLNLAKPLALPAAKAEYPPPLAAIDAAREQGGAWIDAEKAFSWDLPVWVAAGKVDSVELANSHLCRNSVISSEAGGRPRDRLLFPDPAGIGRWSETIYYHLLNCGLRIPPTAGSGSGASPNPVGYNRVYVHVDGDFSYEKWFENLRAGQVVVTNGPMIRPTVEGEYPGHVFQADVGQQVELEIGLTLSTREKVAYLEIIKNGRRAHEVRLDDWAKAGGKLPKLQFDESGWFLVRAVTDARDTYRFASSGPYYVQIGYQPRVSKASAQFFVDWLTERARGLKLEDADQRAEVLKDLRRARDYWQALLDKANAE